MALRDTLKSAAAEDAADIHFEAESAEIIERWQSSILNLHDRISDWLADYVAESAIEIEIEDVEVREDFLGVYQAQALTLRSGRRVVRIQPIARFIVGAVGRIDMYRQGSANPRGRYRLIRMADDRDGSWQIRPPSETERELADLMPMTREAFEAALDTLMS